MQLRVVVKGYSTEFGAITHEHTKHIAKSVDDVKQLKCKLKQIAKELDEGCDSLLGSFSKMVKSCQSFDIESELEPSSQASKVDEK